jgi:hypothetical protein
MPVTFWAGLLEPKTTHEAVARAGLIGDFRAIYASADEPVLVVLFSDRYDARLSK